MKEERTDDEAAFWGRERLVRTRRCRSAFVPDMLQEGKGGLVYSNGVRIEVMDEWAWVGMKERSESNEHTRNIQMRYMWSGGSMREGSKAERRGIAPLALAVEEMKRSNRETKKETRR